MGGYLPPPALSTSIAIWVFQELYRAATAVPRVSPSLIYSVVRGPVRVSLRALAEDAFALDWRF